jgi:hypothetical protein
VNGCDQKKRLRSEKEAGYGHVSVPRFAFCVHVHARALDSCLGYFELELEQREQFVLPVRSREKGLGEAAYFDMVRVGRGYVVEEDCMEDVEEECEEDRGPHLD